MMSQQACIIVPVSEAQSFREQVDKLPPHEMEQINRDYRMLVVPDEWYPKIRAAYESGELEKVVAGGPKALEHWCKLGNNSIVDDSEVAFQREVEKPNQMKEKAVAEQRFDDAANLRDKAARIKRKYKI